MTAQPENLWHATCAETPDAPPLKADTNVDLAIIGGGFTGCSAALAAAEQGARVALIEADEIGQGGSGRNVGLANAGLWLPPEDIVAALGAEAGQRLNTVLAAAPALVFSVIEKHAIACEAVHDGTLHLAHSPAGLRDLENRHRQLTAIGAPVRLLDATETAKRTGSKAFHGALFDPRAGTIQPLGYVRGLARAAAKAGAKLHQQTAARTLRHTNGQWQIETSAGPTIRANRLLLATNAYHHGPASPGTPFIPVHYFQLATAPLPPKLRSTILPGGEGCWDTATVMTSFRLDASGRLLIGAIGQLDHAASGVHRNWARRKLAQLFPALAGQSLTHAWHGRIAMTSDHIPKITRPGPGALAIHGYSGRGIGPGTTLGRAAALALLSDDETGLPLAPIDRHDETMPGIRALYYETGSVLTHLLAARL